MSLKELSSTEILDAFNRLLDLERPIELDGYISESEIDSLEFYTAILEFEDIYGVFDFQNVTGELAEITWRELFQLPCSRLNIGFGHFLFIRVDRISQTFSVSYIPLFK